MSKSSYKIFSLKNKKSFDIINKDAVVLKSRFFIIVAKKVPENMVPQLVNLPEEVVIRRNLNVCTRFLGIKASKKIGNAVSRNLAKRRARAMFYEYCKEIESVACALALIMIPHKLFVTSNYSEIKANFDYLLKKFL